MASTNCVAGPPGFGRVVLPDGGVPVLEDDGSIVTVVEGTIDNKEC